MSRSTVSLATLSLAFGLLVAATALAQSGTGDQSLGPDHLNLDAGAVVISHSGQYNEEWAALLVLDDTTDRGWSAGEGAAFPHEIVVELAQPTALSAVAVSNEGVLEADYPGISARRVEVWGSLDGPDQGFRKILDVEAEKAARSLFELPQPVEARWLKLRIRSNWGHGQYTELMELEAYGEALEVREERPPLAGVYDTNYDLIVFKQEGDQVRGCYDFDGGTLAGTTDGRVVRFQWTENGGDQHGTAIMVLSQSGEQLNGFWYEGGEYQGLWLGARVTDGRAPSCELPPTESLERSLAESGRAIVYGIRFDVDSATLRAESEQTLDEVLTLMQQQPALELIVEGHTDAVGETAYNRELSLRRAGAVVEWLVQRGVERERLEARGLGETQPVADNDTTQGRALNRRVELRRSG